MKKQLIYYYIFPTFLIILLAYFFQSRLLFSGDVGYLLHVANQLLAGGTYAHDFFETNPPMILYLYLPACLLCKLTAISIINASRIYFFFLIFISSSLCFYLMKKLINHPVTLSFAYLMLLFILLFLPA